MSNNNWLFSTMKCPSRIVGEEVLWQGHIALGKSVGVGRIASDVGARLHMDPFNVLHVYRCTDEAILERMKQGYTVNMELVGYTIGMTGSLPYSDSDFNPDANALVVRAYAKPMLRDCLKGITPRNVTKGLKASIVSVMDNVALEEGVLTVASKVLVAGRNLFIGESADEWCRLLTKSGETVATPTVLANTGAALDLDFGELPEDGEYTLVVSARNGASTDYAPAVARKPITIRKAG